MLKLSATRPCDRLQGDDAGLHQLGFEPAFEPHHGAAADAPQGDVRIEPLDRQEIEAAGERLALFRRAAIVSAWSPASSRSTGTRRENSGAIDEGLLMGLASAKTAPVSRGTGLMANLDEKHSNPALWGQFSKARKSLQTVGVQGGGPNASREGNVAAGCIVKEAASRLT